MKIKPSDYGNCAKQTTLAVIEKDGRYWIGLNSCQNPQDSCPRGDMPSGVGYELCDDICGQTGHAETNAIKAAGKKNAEGSNLYLFGHYRICDDCKMFAIMNGVKKIYIINEESVMPYFNWLK